MKKVLLVVLIGLFAIPFQGDCKSPNWWIGISLTFGHGQPGCNGRGLCIIRGEGGGGDGPNKVVGKLENLNGKLSLTIDVSKIDKATMKMQFGDNKFVMEADCKIPDDVAKQLQLSSKSNQLKKGEYKFKQVGKIITIAFN